MSDKKYTSVKTLADDNNGVTTKLAKAGGSEFIVKSVSEQKHSSADLPPVRAVGKQAFTDYGKINSPYLIKYIESFESKNSFEYVLEYSVKGDIFSLFSDKFREKSPISLPKIKSIIAQLSVAVYALHSKNLQHGNIKIDNIYSLNDEGDKVKIGGFGINYPTYNGLPPEIRSKQPASLKTDIYSLGYVLQQLFSSQAVVRSSGASSRSDLSEGLKNLVAQMLSENPNSRPSISQVVQNADVKDAILNLPKDTLPAELLAELQPSKSATSTPAPAPASAPASAPAPAAAKAAAPAAAKPASSPPAKAPLSSPSKPIPAYAQPKAAGAPASAPLSVDGLDGTPAEKFEKLTDADYQTAFGMTKEAFAKQPGWKQQQVRKAKNLW